MDLNFPVFATGVRIFRASNDVGPLFVGPGSTRILEKKGSVYAYNNFQQIVVRITANLILTTNDITKSIQ
jgi:hypothetical protein